MSRRVLLSALLCLLGCGNENGPHQVTGSVSYRQGIPFPPNASVHVMLLDTSLQGARPGALADQTIVAEARQDSVTFALSYDPRAVDKNHTYAVRADVTVDGATHFVSTEAYPVPTKRRSERVDITVNSVWQPRFPPDPDAPPGAVVLVGEYSYMADAGIFVHCGTGARYPVAQQADNAALERAYTKLPHDPGAPVIVTVLARIEPGPPMEGRPQDHLIVDRFLQVWPGESCETAGVQTPLVNTYWKLVEIDGEPVAAREGQREAHIMLHVDGQRADGFAGCNNFSGDYIRNDWNVRFGRMAATRMACPDLDREQKFLAALEKAIHYRIVGETLDLCDERGPVARFHAVYLR